jgi:hypothetical protein
MTCAMVGLPMKLSRQLNELPVQWAVAPASEPAWQLTTQPNTGFRIWICGFRQGMIDGTVLKSIPNPP